MNYISAVALAIFVFVMPGSVSGQDRTINIIYSGGLNGELESCGCSPKTNFGGLARLAGFLMEHKEGLSPYLLVDAGNFTSGDTPQGRLKAEAMLKSFSILQYDAVAFMRNEREFADDFFPPLIKKYSIPAVSGRPHYERTLAVVKGDLTINVSADPKGFAKEGLNILLTDLPVADAGAFKGWDVIISSFGEEVEGPQRVDGTVIAAGFPRGKKTGVLTLELDEAGNVGGFNHAWLLLGDDVEEGEAVRSILDDYDAEVAALLKAGKPLPGTTYLGVSKCADCHQPYVESWEKTSHAGAFASLENAGKSADPECIVCHSVGYGEKGGFFSPETTPELANVQCEECHGLDREHLDDFSRPMRPVSKKVCLKCHTKENSPDFNYPVYYEKIKH